MSSTYTDAIHQLAPGSSTKTVTTSMAVAPAIVAEETTTTTVTSTLNHHEKMIHEQQAQTGMGLGWLGHLILWAFIFFVFWWLIFFSTKLWFVLDSSSNVDTARVAGWAAVAALLTLVIVWIIVWIVRKSKRC